MATAREYFDKDSRQRLRAHSIHKATDPKTGEQFDIIAAMLLDFDAGAKYGAIYIPDIAIAPNVIEHYLTNVHDILQVTDGVLVSWGFANTSERVGLEDLSFSGRIIVYTPYRFAPEESIALQASAARAGVKLLLRDCNYVEGRAKADKPLAFISHDWRDKETLVRDLAANLQKMLCPVWYDEYSLIAGQSLRESIEKGLLECAKCVIVLSPSFLSNEGWTKAEFDSIFMREIIEKKRVIVPIWHGVSKQEVYDYSMRLADIVGIPSSLGVEEVARRVVVAINHQAP